MFIEEFFEEVNASLAVIAGAHAGLFMVVLWIAHRLHVFLSKLEKRKDR